MNKIKLFQITDTIEEHFPLSTQAEWDNSGLQIGNPDDDISGIVFTLDVSDEVIDEAIKRGANLIISHHPLIFHPIKSVTETTGKGNLILKAIRNKINIYSSHTPADKGKGGLNDWISDRLSLIDPRPLSEDGTGIVGALPKAMNPDEFSTLLKKVFTLPYLEATYAYSNEIRIVALCSGSGMSLVSDAINQGADTYITGDISWGGYSEWRKDINLCNITHFHSENQFTEIASCIIKKKFPKFAVHCHNISLTNYW